MVDDLVNNIIFGVILVVVVLMFFLGFRNALFVGFAIPLSMFLSFIILSSIGFTLNTMVLFALVMGLGMLVDNGIVVVENVYSLMSQGMPQDNKRQNKGWPKSPGLLSPLPRPLWQPFSRLGLWPGTIGKFMMLLSYYPLYCTRIFTVCCIDHQLHADLAVHEDRRKEPVKKKTDADKCNFGGNRSIVAHRLVL